MKAKILKFILVGVLVNLFLFSCRQESSENNNANYDKYFQTMGKFHNESLYAIMKDINKNSNKYARIADPSTEALEFYKDYSIDYMHTIEPLWDDQEINNFLDNFSTLYDDSIPEPRIVNEFDRITNTQYYLDLIDIVDTNSEKSIIDAKIDILISQLENDSTINEIDKITLKSTMLIAKSSFEFWMNETSNTAKIRNKYSSKNSNSRIYIKNKYLKADIEGAVSGAITGAITGPQGAAIGAMLGAPWGSAVSGFFDKYIW